MSLESDTAGSKSSLDYSKLTLTVSRIYMGALFRSLRAAKKISLCEAVKAFMKNQGFEQESYSKVNTLRTQLSRFENGKSLPHLHDFLTWLQVLAPDPADVLQMYSLVHCEIIKKSQEIHSGKIEVEKARSEASIFSSTLITPS